MYWDENKTERSKLLLVTRLLCPPHFKQRLKLGGGGGWVDVEIVNSQEPRVKVSALAAAGPALLGPVPPPQALRTFVQPEVPLPVGTACSETPRARPEFSSVTHVGGNIGSPEADGRMFTVSASMFVHGKPSSGFVISEEAAVFPNPGGRGGGGGLLY